MLDIFRPTMNGKICFLAVVFSVVLTFGEALNYYEPLKYSFQIKTNGLQDVSSLIPGTMISFKKMTTPTEGVRITAGIGGGSTVSNQNYGTSENESDSFSLALYVTKLKYAYRNKNLYLYYGYGPFGKYSYQFSTSSYEQIKTNTISGGLNGCLGVEWFFSKQFSLFAEYSLNASANYSRANYLVNGSNLTPSIANQSTTKGFSFNSNPVLIGLSIYL